MGLSETPGKPLAPAYREPVAKREGARETNRDHSQGHFILRLLGVTSIV